MINEPIDPFEPDERCPLTAALDALGGKWALVCLYWVAAEPRRFNEMRRLMPGVSHKVLTETLRNLEMHAILTRTTVSESPLHVEYALSSHGQSVLPLLETMRGWGRQHLNFVDHAAPQSSAV